jgi:hypothetical protein
MLLVVLIWAITIALFISGNAFWEHRVWRGVWTLIVGLGLAFAFFRNRKIVFVTIMLTFILVNVGFTAIFHPSLVGYLLTFGSAAGLYLIVRWGAARYPGLKQKDMHKFFDHDPE